MHGTRNSSQRAIFCRVLCGFLAADFSVILDGWTNAIPCSITPTAFPVPAERPWLRCMRWYTVSTGSYTLLLGGARFLSALASLLSTSASTVLVFGGYGDVWPNARPMHCDGPKCQVRLCTSTKVGICADTTGPTLPLVVVTIDFNSHVNDIQSSSEKSSFLAMASIASAAPFLASRPSPAFHQRAVMGVVRVGG